MGREGCVQGGTSEIDFTDRLLCEMTNEITDDGPDGGSNNARDRC